MAGITYRLRKPDLLDANPRWRHQGLVNAEIDGLVAGTLSFGEDPTQRIIRTTNFSVVARRRGIATALVHEVLEAYPGYELVESPGSNSEAGAGLLQALRNAGVPYHTSQCFLPGGGFAPGDDPVGNCVCALGGRVRAS